MVDVCVTTLASSPNLSDEHELKSDEFTAAMKESPRRYTNPFLSDEENDKLNFWNNPVEDDFTTNLEDETFKKSLAHSNNIPSESFKKAKELYVDKNITECEQNGFHVVKDICVDEGLRHEEKVLIEKENHGLFCNPVLFNGDKHDDMIGENLDTQFLKHEKMRSDLIVLEPTNDHRDTGKCNDADILVQNGENSPQNALKNVSEDDNGPSNCVPDEEKLDLGSNSLNYSSTEQLVSGSVLILNQDQALTSIKILESNNGVNDVDRIRSPEEEILKRPLVGSEAEELERSSIQISNISNDIKPAPNNQNNVASDNVTMVNQLQRGEAESSFSMAGAVVSGLITYSGPIPSSGSISLRSDSSTTSVRSFAFPVLQTEWNSSPIRMAKPVRRRSRKHRGWKKALLCCRF